MGPVLTLVQGEELGAEASCCVALRMISACITDCLLLARGAAIAGRSRPAILYCIGCSCTLVVEIETGVLCVGVVVSTPGSPGVGPT